MSVLIKGMEIPESCFECYFQDGGNCCILNNHKNVVNCIIEDQRDEDCPLVPVPPHGRLIDADVLSQIYRFDDYGKAVVDCEDIDNAPTIIEAEADDG